jgi:hypothetical protein
VKARKFWKKHLQEITGTRNLQTRSGKPIPCGQPNPTFPLPAPRTPAEPHPYPTMTGQSPALRRGFEGTVFSTRLRTEFHRVPLLARPAVRRGYQGSTAGQASSATKPAHAAHGVAARFRHSSLVIRHLGTLPCSSNVPRSLCRNSPCGSAS